MGAEQKYAIPTDKDSIVRYPRTKTKLPEAGGYVPWVGPEGRYWRRRLKDGSIKIQEKSPSPKLESTSGDYGESRQYKKEGGSKQKIKITNEEK